MAQFSTEAISSACEAIAERNGRTTTKIDSLLESVDSQEAISHHLQELSTQMEQLAEASEELREALGRSWVVSQGAQDVLVKSVGPAAEASAVMAKQIGEVQPGLVGKTMDTDVVERYHDHQEIHAQLFSAVAGLLELSELESQEAQVTEMLSSENSPLVENAIKASKDVMKIGSVLSRQPEAQAPAEPSQPSSSQAQQPEQSPPSYSTEKPKKNDGKSSQGGFFSSLTHGIHAITASMRPKPEPMVIAMCSSAETGNVAHVKGFLDQGANINGKNEPGYTALISAVRTNQPAVVELLLNAGADKSIRDSATGEWKPPLFHAATLGHVKITQMLLDAGADMKERPWSGQPYFVDVACSDNIDVIRCFLEHGAEANMISMSGRSIFTHAMRSGSLPHIQLLAEFGGDVNARDINGRPALHTALYQSRDDIVQFLLQRGADPNAVDFTGTCLLLAAVQKKNYALVKMLLTRGANPNVSDIRGKPPIVMLLESKDIEENLRTDIVRLFLTKGVDPNTSDSWGTPLMSHAMKSNSIGVLREFLKAGGKADTRIKRQETLLLYAIDQGRDDQAYLLLEHGADANKDDKNGRTPLVEALQRDSPRLVGRLLDAGANVNKAGMISPLALAKLTGQQDVTKRLVAKGAKVPKAQTSDASRPSSVAGPSSPHGRRESDPHEVPPPYTDERGSQEGFRDRKS